MEIRRIPPITCADGYVLSVQASTVARSTPQSNVGPWAEFDVAQPDRGPISGLEAYLDAPPESGYYYHYVPIDKIRALVEAHGGTSDDWQSSPQVNLEDLITAKEPEDVRQVVAALGGRDHVLREILELTLKSWPDYQRRTDIGEAFRYVCLYCRG